VRDKKPYTVTNGLNVRGTKEYRRGCLSDWSWDNERHEKEGPKGLPNQLLIVLVKFGHYN